MEKFINQHLALEVNANWFGTASVTPAGTARGRVKEGKLKASYHVTTFS